MTPLPLTTSIVKREIIIDKFLGKTFVTFRGKHFEVLESSEGLTFKHIKIKNFDAIKKKALESIQAGSKKRMEQVEKNEAINALKPALKLREKSIQKEPSGSNKKDSDSVDHLRCASTGARTPPNSQISRPSEFFMPNVIKPKPIFFAPQFVGWDSIGLKDPRLNKYRDQQD